jgi:hypothetical protein
LPTFMMLSSLAGVKWYVFFNLNFFDNFHRM